MLFVDARSSDSYGNSDEVSSTTLPAMELTSGRDSAIGSGIMHASLLVDNGFIRAGR